MSDSIVLTPEWAAFIAAWVRETLPLAPPAHQRNTGEWLLEQLEACAAADQGAAATQSADATPQSDSNSTEAVPGEGASE